MTESSGRSPVTRRERRWALAFALLVMLALTLPYLLGYARQGEDWAFTGFLYGVEDGNSYIAKMLRGYAGDWLFRTPYTAQPQGGAVVLLPYLLLGKLTAPPAQHEQLVALYHLFRYAAGVLAVLATYDFAALFLKRVDLRRWATALATLGGGLGWLLVILGQGNLLGSLPLDFYSPESFGFLALFGLLHLALGRALLLWGLVAYLRPAPESPRFLDRPGVKTGLLWLALGLVQPLFVVVGWAVIGAHALALLVRGYVRDHQMSWGTHLRPLTWPLLLSAPMVVYTAVHFQLDPFLAAWTAQNLLPSPHPLHYLLAYGLVLPPAVFGARALIRQDARRGWLPAAWVVVLPLLVYFPINVQRRLAEGVWVALVVLAIVGIEAFAKERAGLVRAVLAALVLPTSLLLWVGGFQAAWSPAEPVFRPSEELAAFEQLATVAEEGEVVLAAYSTGNALPAWAPLRVVAGLGTESIGWPGLEMRIAGFYQSGTGDAERLALLSEFGVSYVFWGPEERALGDWWPASADYLRSVVEVGEYAVFEVLMEGD